MSVWAVVVAAGRGERYGRTKQYDVVGGRRVVDWSVSVARACCDGVVVVVAAGEPTDLVGVEVVVTGGATRSESVRAGLAAVPVDASVIVVHDAARPAAPVALFERVIAAVIAGVDGAVPGVAVTDTVKVVADDASVVETLDRDRLVAVQTPQAFRADALRAAYASGHDASDDAGLVERAGGRVVVVAGDPSNVKLTRPADLAALDAVLANRS